MAFTIPVQKGEQQTPPIIFSDKEIEKWMKEGESVNSTICALLVGHPKTGKSGVALDCRTSEEIKDGKKVVVIEMNSDNGCKICKKEHHNDDPNIIVLDPREVTIDIETGDYHLDYIKSMAKIKSLLQYLKTNKDKLNIKAIVFDGVDVFLSEVCEGQMRLEKHLDAASGVSQLYWKLRNSYFYEVMNMLFTIDVDKYLITHYKKDDKDNLIYAVQTTFPDKVHQIVEFHKEGTKFYAKMVCDRRKITDDRLNKDVVIAEQLDNGMKWYGLRI